MDGKVNSVVELVVKLEAQNTNLQAENERLKKLLLKVYNTSCHLLDSRLRNDIRRITKKDGE